MAEVFDYLYAGREPDQVVGIGQRIRVIEIVHAPRETAFRVAPGAEAVNVKVATRENLRSVAQVGANLRPQLSPSIERTAKKHEQVAAHLLVLQPQIGLDDGSATAHPTFVTAGSLQEIHRGPQLHAEEDEDIGGGEGGIRTLGTGYPVRQISNVAAIRERRH